MTTAAPEREKWTLTVPQVSERLGISKQTIYDAIKAGTVPVIRGFGRRLLIPTAWLEEKCGRRAELEDESDELVPAPEGGRH